MAELDVSDSVDVDEFNDDAAGLFVEVVLLSVVAEVVAIVKVVVVVVVVVVASEQKQTKRVGCLFQPKNAERIYQFSSAGYLSRKSVRLV